MTQNTPLSVEQMMEEIRLMRERLHSVRGFKIAQSIKSQIKMMADCVREDNIHGARKAAKEALAAGRNILRAFLRHAVIDQPDKVSYLTREIRIRQIEKVYHEDLVGYMEARRQKFEEAARAESDEDFTLRIALYNEAMAAVDKADEDQRLRDALRISRDKVKKNAKRDEDRTAELERHRADAAARREEAVAERNRVADELLALAD